MGRTRPGPRAGLNPLDPGARDADMSDITGTWNLTMRTPIGSIRADLTFRDVDGTLTGVAAGEHETVPLRDLQLEPVEEGERVRWTQTITKPMRLTSTSTSPEPATP